MAGLSLKASQKADTRTINQLQLGINFVPVQNSLVIDFKLKKFVFVKTNVM